MFTITSIKSNITIGRDLPPTSPAIRLDERGIQVNGTRPLDLALGESTIVEYPISERDETPIRRLRCKVTRLVDTPEVPNEIPSSRSVSEIVADEMLPACLPRYVADQEQKRNDFEVIVDKAGDPGTTMLAVASTETPAPKPSSLAATIERAREASEDAPAQRRGGRRSARRSES